MNDELLHSEGLIRRLKKGSPIVLEKETIRLPRFTEIKEVDQQEVGGAGKDTLVVARSRTATWALLPWPKKGAFALKDAVQYLSKATAVDKELYRDAWYPLAYSAFYSSDMEKAPAAVAAAARRRPAAAKRHLLHGQLVELRVRLHVR